MNLPLPNDLREAIKGVSRSAAPNLSLKFYKWADIYDPAFKNTVKEKFSYFQDFVEYSKQKEYWNAFEIRRKLIPKMGGVSFTMVTACRLIVGLGYDHPAKTGFLFDWISGLPFIPGSSLKGVARDTAENICPGDVGEIFGSLKTGEGSIIFLPAYPEVQEDKPFLEVDVMTPHYSKYYMGHEPPADYHSPTPIHFLTVPADIKFNFRLVNRMNYTDKTLPERAGEVLKTALKDTGVGAKTGVSYGYFKP